MLALAAQQEVGPQGEEGFETVRDIFDDNRLTQRFFEIIESGDDRLRCYIYRVENGKPRRPALIIG